MNEDPNGKDAYWILTPFDIKLKVLELEKNKSLMISYLKLKLTEQDYHGVQDAASDIRDIDSMIDGLRFGIGIKK